MVYVISSEAMKINEEFSKLMLSRYRYVSYKKSTLEERLESMHFNEMKNVKAYYETLFNISLKDRVMENLKYVDLQTYLMNIKENNEQLFLAVE